MEFRYIRRNVGLIGCVLLLFTGISKWMPTTETFPKPRLHSEVFKAQNGYGYLILVDDKVLIKQDFIPAIEGKKSFLSSKQAKLVADLVLYKLSQGANPEVSAEEIYDLGLVP
ncbi:MAG: DUF4907 domain-containing protein [Saonia sp.]